MSWTGSDSLIGLDAGPQTPPHAGTLEFAWTLARAPLARAEFPVAPGAGTHERPVLLRLLVELDPPGRLAGQGSARCVAAGLTDEDDRVRVDLPGPAAPGTGSWTTGEDDLLHVDIDGLLRATLRGTRVLYAATPLLTALGVPGGRSDVRRAVTRTSHNPHDPHAPRPIGLARA